MARLPAGQRPPADGALREAALAGLGTRPFGIYVHVPYCASICGYCDFNTYVTEPQARAGYPAGGRPELALAGRPPGGGAPAVDTVFVGGGTPTLLGSGALGEILAAID